MFVRSVLTPNPNTVKFYPGGIVFDGGVLDIARDAGEFKYKIIADLMGIDGVQSIMCSLDFMSVTKTDDLDWDMLKPQIIEVILRYRGEDELSETYGTPLLQADAEDEGFEIMSCAREEYPEDSIEFKIVSLLDQFVVPRLMDDGGYAEFCGYSDGVVRLKLRGACSTCPSATMTLKHGIKGLLSAYLPEIIDVEEVLEDGCSNVL